MSRLLPAVLHPPLLSAVELRAAELDGELFAIGAGWQPADLPPSAAARALSLRPELPPRAIIADRTAAWVWGWTSRRVGVAICIDASARISTTHRRGFRAREVVIDGDELQRPGGVAVTSPARTIVDLARHDEGDDVVVLIAAGMRQHGLSAMRVGMIADRRPSSAGRRRAHDRVRAAAELLAAERPGSAVADAVDVVDGVDAAHGVEHAVEVRRIAHLEDEPAEGEAVA